MPRAKENRRKQIRIISVYGRARRIRRKKRNQEEIVLLIKAMMKDIRGLEEKGVVVKNGPKWKINI